MNTHQDILRTPQAEYIGVADTAKLIRGAIAKAFPGQKFSVKSDSYSGGASIHVKYTGGPMASDVDAILDPYRGGDFDGSIDMKYSRYSWLAPDGSASAAYSRGTVDNRGSDPGFIGDAHAAGSKYVRFGADFIFVERSATPGEYWECIDRFERLTGLAVRHDTHRAGHYERTGEKGRRGNWLTRWVDDGERITPLYCFTRKCSEPWRDEWYHDSKKLSEYVNGLCSFGFLINRHEPNIQTPPLVVAMSEIERAERAKYIGGGE